MLNSRLKRSQMRMNTGFEDDFGYWVVCTKCRRKLEGGHHYYNHYDGEDHEDIDCYM